MSKLICFCGPDRVGKSTAAAAVASTGAASSIIHFTGPRPEHSTPYQQYESLLNPQTSITIADRCWLEASFYDRYRRGIVYDDVWLTHFERRLKKTYASVVINLIVSEWDSVMVCRHLRELQEQAPQASGWWLDNQLSMRKREHEAYYRFIEEIEAKSLFSLQYLYRQ